jgi:hypothetical protein
VAAVAVQVSSVLAEWELLMPPVQQAPTAALLARQIPLGPLTQTLAAAAAAGQQRPQATEIMALLLILAQPVADRVAAKILLTVTGRLVQGVPRQEGASLVAQIYQGRLLLGERSMPADNVRAFVAAWTWAALLVAAALLAVLLTMLQPRLEAMAVSPEVALAGVEAL